MKTLIFAFIVSLIVHLGRSQDLEESNNNAVSYLAQQYCTHGEVLRCSDDCKGRQFCMYGNEVNIDCYTQTGRYCNQDTLECTAVSNSGDCKSDPYFICPGEGSFPHALNCSKFWLCGSKPPPTEVVCGSLVYDPVNKKCATGIPCYTFSPLNGLCKGKNGAIVVHPLNKAIYAYCFGDFPQVGECPPNLTFNTAKLKCEYECKMIGRFEDPVDEACYYSCTRPHLTLVSERICCPAGKIFSPQYLTCIPIVPPPSA